MTAAAMTISAMRGTPFLGKFDVKKKGTVMYFDEENPRSEWQRRKLGFADSDPFLFAHFKGLKLDIDKDFRVIQEQVDRYKPVLVVFDSLIRFHNCEENSASEMAVVMNRLRQIANMVPCVLTQIHQNKQGELRTRSRGSSDIIGACDLELALTEKEGIRTLQSVKARMMPIAPINLTFVEYDGRLEIEEAELGAEETNAIKEILILAGDWMSIAQIMEELTAQGIKVSRDTVSRRLGDMKEELLTSLGTRNTMLYKIREEM